MPEDKFGNEIEQGDTVEFVYGGDAYATQIDALAEMEGRTWVQATITVFIPAGSVALVEKAPKPAPKKAGQAPQSPAPQHAADAAADHIATTAATETGGADTALEKPTKSSSSSKKGSK